MKRFRFSAPIMKEAFGRIFLQDHYLRDALEKNPVITFQAGVMDEGFAAWAITFRSLNGQVSTLVDGDRNGLAVGAELFRKWTGKDMGFVGDDR